MALSSNASIAQEDAGDELVFKVEPNHSTIGFAIAIMGGATRVRGKFTDFDIVIRYNRENFEKSSVEVTIKSFTIDTGIDDRDHHLMSPDFFHSQEHPLITFKSERIEKRNGGWVAIGDFSMHGVTRKIELPFEFKEMTMPMRDKPFLSISSRTTLSRKVYGVGMGFRHDYEKEAAAAKKIVPPFLGIEVEVEIDLWTRSAKKPGDEESQEE